MSELIDRQALIADYRICGGCNGFENCSGHITMCDSSRIRQAINEAPTIEVVPVRYGRWIPVDGEPYTKCSYCGEKHYGCTTPYCDMCGAHMKKKGVDNDSLKMEDDV